MHCALHHIGRNVASGADPQQTDSVEHGLSAGLNNAYNSMAYDEAADMTLNLGLTFDRINVKQSERMIMMMQVKMQSLTPEYCYALGIIVSFNTRINLALIYSGVPIVKMRVFIFSHP